MISDPRRVIGLKEYTTMAESCGSTPTQIASNLSLPVHKYPQRNAACCAADFRIMYRLSPCELCKTLWVPVQPRVFDRHHSHNVEWYNYTKLVLDIGMHCWRLYHMQVPKSDASASHMLRREAWELSTVGYFWAMSCLPSGFCWVGLGYTPCKMFIIMNFIKWNPW